MPNAPLTPLNLAAFSRGAQGGNGAGVVIGAAMPPEAKMQALARELGHSETVFATQDGTRWVVRYFSPQAEVAFCGHATIALGAALGAAHGPGRYDLHLTSADISVTAHHDGKNWTARLQSPPTHSGPLSPDRLADLLNTFGLTADDLDPQLPPTLANAGNDHPILALRSRGTLAAMAYDFDRLRDLMAAHKWTTISLLHIENDTTFHARNAFAIGGVVEDAATGAAAAALGGALVDLGWPSVRDGGNIVVYQGDDMGAPSTLHVRVTGKPGDSVEVSGTVRTL